jgi:hypothetical protein
MESCQYCIYNQTSECFLSLGVTPEDRGFARFKGLLRLRAPRYDEVHWVSRPKGVHLFRFFSSRDLLFLDAKHRVVRAIELFPPFRFVPVGENIASVLELPVHTIDSSQTQPGNQLVICLAEEMEFRLRSMPDLEKDDRVELSAENLPVRNTPSARQDRRTTPPPALAPVACIRFGRSRSESPWRTGPQRERTVPDDRDAMAARHTDHPYPAEDRRG